MNLSSLLCLLILLFSTQKKDPYYNHQGRPSSWGIHQYIKNNEENLIAEYECRVDSIYDVFIFTEDLSKEDDHDSLELARFYIPDYIYLTTEEKYIEYEFKNLSKFKQKNINPTENTLKGVLFHELSHAYFYQIILLTKMDSMRVSPEYGIIRFFPSPALRFGAEFIEEGVCEYIVEKTGEQPIDMTDYKPKNKEEILQKEKMVDIKYRYSVQFIRKFMDQYGVNMGVRILVVNKPPTIDEIMNPNLFFERLNYNGIKILHPNEQS